MQPIALLYSLTTKTDRSPIIVAVGFDGKKQFSARPTPGKPFVNVNLAPVVHVEMSDAGIRNYFQ